jgi:hypothetical protein
VDEQESASLLTKTWTEGDGVKFVDAVQCYPMLYDADPQCSHEIESLWDGIRCRNCRGWFCY